MPDANGNPTPEDFLHNVGQGIHDTFISPIGGFLGGIFGQPAPGSAPTTSASGVPLPPTEAVDAFLNKVSASTLLSPTDKTIIIEQIRANPETMGQFQLIFDQMETNARQTAAADTQQQETERVRQENLDRLGGIQTQGNDFYNTQINRFADPATGQLRGNLLSRDAELANIIAQGEQSINANVQRARNNAALSQSGSGSLSSGKMTSQISNTENQAAGQRGYGRSNLLGQIRGNLDTLRGNQLTFNEGITNAQNATNAGLMPDYAGLSIYGSQTPNFTNPYEQLFGETQTKFGQDLAGIGVVTDLIGLGVNAGTNGFNTLFGGKK